MSPCTHVGVIEAHENLNFHQFLHLAPKVLTSTRCVQTGSGILSVLNLTAMVCTL